MVWSRGHVIDLRHVLGPAAHIILQRHPAATQLYSWRHRLRVLWKDYELCRSSVLRGWTGIPADICIHFPTMGKSVEAGVFTFARVWVWLDCGMSQFTRLGH